MITRDIGRYAVLSSCLLFLLLSCADSERNDDEQSRELSSSDFLLTVCVHPEWIAADHSEHLEALVRAGVAILEGTRPSFSSDVGWHQIDLLTVILHEFMHLKGVRGHLPDEESGIMSAWVFPGEQHRELSVADQRLLEQSEQVWALEYVGVTNDCDAPVGFRELEAPALGKAFYTADGPFVWFDIRDDWYFATLP